MEASAYVTHASREWLTPRQIVGLRRRASEYLGLRMEECTLGKHVDVPDWAAFSVPHNRFAFHTSLLHVATGDVYAIKAQVDTLRRNASPQDLIVSKTNKRITDCPNEFVI